MKRLEEHERLHKEFQAFDKNKSRAIWNAQGMAHMSVQEKQHWLASLHSYLDLSFAADRIMTIETYLNQGSTMSINDQDTLPTLPDDPPSEPEIKVELFELVHCSRCGITFGSGECDTHGKEFLARKKK